MLHKDKWIISDATFQLIQELQELHELKGFHLVGGTALALKLGHRNSIDIDLFTTDEFNAQELATFLEKRFGFNTTFSKKSTLLGVINGVKTDFVRHDYKLIHDPYLEEGISFLSLEDIAAMKLHAISNSGKRLKDFIDVYFLLTLFSLEEMIGFYSIKYPNFNPMIPMKSINYFEDIDYAIEPPMLKKTIDITTIKARINESVLHFNKRF